ncbi:testis-specific chromodomain protein Y 1 [Aphelenchoides avenae]|nr:testis-specific chromodomain protein Y 1 [Aphelenchus avenae]
MLAIKNGEYEVEAVVGRRELNGITEYLVKWHLYAWDSCTWEPEENLSNAEQCIGNYNAAPAYYEAQYHAEMILLQEYNNP